MTRSERPDELFEAVCANGHLQRLPDGEPILARDGERVHLPGMDFICLCSAPVYGALPASCWPDPD